MAWLLQQYRKMYYKMYKKCFNVSKIWQNYKFVISKLISFFSASNLFFEFFFLSHLFVFVVFLILSFFLMQATFTIGWNLSNEREKCSCDNVKMSFECHKNLCVACEKIKMEVRSLSNKFIIISHTHIQKIKGSISICCFILKLMLRVFFLL